MAPPPIRSDGDIVMNSGTTIVKIRFPWLWLVDADQWPAFPLPSPPTPRSDIYGSAN